MLAIIIGFSWKTRLNQTTQVGYCFEHGLPHSFAYSNFVCRDFNYWVIIILLADSIKRLIFVVSSNEIARNT